jgi:hypothetical protein
MEANVATSSGSPRTPVMDYYCRGHPTSSPTFLVRTTVVLTPSTSGSGLIPLMTSTTMFHLLRMRWALPSHMGCPTLIQTRFLLILPYRPWVWGKGAQTLPCKGQPWALLSLLMLSLMVGVIYLLRPLRSTVLFSSQSGLMLIIACLVEDSLGPSSYTIGGIYVVLFVRCAFGNNAFSSIAFLTGGNPSFGQQNPVQGTIPSQGAMTGVYSTQGLWNPWQGSVPFARNVSWG